MVLLQQSQNAFASVSSQRTTQAHFSNQITAKTNIHPHALGITFALKLRSILHAWILDLGAIDHIGSSVDLFTSYQTISSIPIRSPNENQVIPNIDGTVCFSNIFILHRVLYLPSFSFSLISVSKLTQSLHRHLQFTNKLCYLGPTRLKEDWIC